VNPWDKDGLVKLYAWPKLKAYFESHWDVLSGRNVGKRNPGKEHRTIDRVTADYTALRFNTAVARLTELNNRLTQLAASGPLPRSLVEPMVLLAAPLVPHVAEELWSRLGHTESLAYHPFPVADPARMVAETVLYPVQVNGKLRGKIEVPADAEAAAIEAAALDRVAQSLDGRQPKRVIVVPGRIVTVVV